MVLRHLSAAGGGGSGGVTIGDAVTGGTPTQILYTDNTGNLTSDSNATRDSSTQATNLQRTVGTETAGFQINDNILGLGFTGLQAIYQDSSTFPTLVAGIAAGDSTIATGNPGFIVAVGILDPLGSTNIEVGFLNTYDVPDDRSVSQLHATNSTGNVAQIMLEADPSGSQIKLQFGGGNSYTMPNTSPSLGQVIGYTGSNQLGFVTGGGGSATPGGSDTNVQFNNSSVFDGSADFTWDYTNRVFTVGDPTFAANSTTFQLDDSNSQIYLRANNSTLIQDASSATIASFEPSSGHPRIIMGDNTGAGNHTVLELNDNDQDVHIAANGGLNVATAAGAQWLVVNPFGHLVEYGDISGSQNSTAMILNDMAETITNRIATDFVVKNISGARFLDLDLFNKVYELGDIDSIHNGNVLQVDDGNQNISAITQSQFNVSDLSGTSYFQVATGSDYIQVGPSGNNGTFIMVEDGTQNISWQNQGHEYLNFDFSSRVYEFGDINGVNFGTLLKIDDTGAAMSATVFNQFYIQNDAGHLFFDIQPNNGVYQMGDINVTSNGTRLVMDDTGQTVTFELNNIFSTINVAGNRSLYIDASSYSWYAGDFDQVANKTVWHLDDSSQEIIGSVDGTFIVGDTSSDPFLIIDTVSHKATIGDAGLAFNSTNLVVDDSTKNIKAIADTQFSVQNISGKRFLSINPTSGQSGFGDIDALVHGTKFNVLDPTKTIVAIADTQFDVQNTSGNRFLAVTPTARQAGLGDIDNAFNHTVLNVDDIAQTYTLNKLGGSGNTLVGVNNSGVLNNTVAAIVRNGNDLTGQTTAVSSIATITPSADGTFRIGGYITVTAISINVLNLQVTYTDETSASRTQTFAVMGTTSPSINATGAYTFSDIQIRAKSGSPITVLTTATGIGSQTYDVGATIEQLR